MPKRKSNGWTPERRRRQKATLAAKKVSSIPLDAVPERPQRKAPERQLSTGSSARELAAAIVRLLTLVLR
jgi:hypothetical protein